jgi:glycosyltransferase involved in cell wall biosynthesis
MSRYYSFIIPVYNRPSEVDELLESFVNIKFNKLFEIVIIEDGSTLTCESVLLKYQEILNISYYFKPNSGPGDSRNYGMNKALGNYFIILDSDCLLTEDYLNEVDKALDKDYVDFFGGPDSAHHSFTKLQKAINFVMTSFITTGGIRGNKKTLSKFQPRSFNMGISKEAFLESKGFGNIHPGEDPDLTLRLWKLGFNSKLLEKAVVFHKRRISWQKFYKQVYKFGSVRPILNVWHPKSKKLTYWLPGLYLIFTLVALILLILQLKWAVILLLAYNALVFLIALLNTKDFVIALQVMYALQIQFLAYGYGFIKSTLMLSLSKKSPEDLFPELFFKK